MNKSAMDSRYATLLIGLVQEYIRTARPVGSGQLLKGVQLNISPATVRHMLHELDAEGYITQPHTSAGRIPTDKGYRFYVDHLHLHLASEARRRTLTAQLQEAEQQYQHLARAVSKLLARVSQSGTAIGFLPEGTVQETGLHEVLKQPEGDDTATMQEVSRILESVDEHLPQLSQAAAHVTVYIGRENPYLPAQYTSVIVRSVALPDCRTAVLALIGPKRMPYPRNMALLEHVAQILQQHSL